MSELKPCPFCGEEQLSDKERGDTIPYDGRYSRVCDWCDVESPYWNTRPIEDAQAQEIARLEQRIRELEEAQRWIPVSERLPEEGEYVSVIFGEDEKTVGCWFLETETEEYQVIGFEYKQWEVWNFGESKFVYVDEPPTHWRPLPPPPEEE